MKQIFFFIAFIALVLIKWELAFVGLYFLWLVPEIRNEMDQVKKECIQPIIDFVDSIILFKKNNNKQIMVSMDISQP